MIFILNHWRMLTAVIFWLWIHQLMKRPCCLLQVVFHLVVTTTVWQVPMEVSPHYLKALQRISNTFHQHPKWAHHLIHRQDILHRIIHPVVYRLLTHPLWGTVIHQQPESTSPGRGWARWKCPLSLCNIASLNHRHKCIQSRHLFLQQ